MCIAYLEMLPEASFLSVENMAPQLRFAKFCLNKDLWADKTNVESFRYNGQCKSLSKTKPNTASQTLHTNRCMVVEEVAMNSSDYQSIL